MFCASRCAPHSHHFMALWIAQFHVVLLLPVRTDDLPWSMQTARHLLKSCEAAAAGKQIQGSAAYLTDTQSEMEQKCQVQSGTHWRAADVLLAALRCDLKPCFD